MKIFSLLLTAVLLTACGQQPAKGQADYDLAVKYMRGIGVQKDEAKAMDYLRRASDAGNVHGQLGLGYMYLKGVNVEKDASKAVQLFERAAKQGSIDAQYNLGLAYARGDGATKDLVKSGEWFKKAALQDDAGSQYNMGVLYMSGEGVSRDPLMAFAWFSLAFEKQYNGAKEGMSAAAQVMTQEEAAQSDAAVKKLRAMVVKPKGEVSSSAASQEL
jgi:TPR repeat protein